MINRPSGGGGSAADKQLSIAIYGAGEAGRHLAKEILNNGNSRHIVGFFDDLQTAGTEILAGIRVLGGRASMGYWIEKHLIDEIYLAIPSLQPAQNAALAEEIRRFNVKVQALPPVRNLIIGTSLKKQLQKDLLSTVIDREVRDIDLPRILSFIAGKNVLVTGAGGSIGSELVRQCSRFNPNNLILLDQYDTHLHEIQTWLDDRAFSNFTPILANIREPNSFEHVFRSWDIDLVIHAAAIKHVPLAENNVCETMRTNALGTLNLLELSSTHDVSHFILISTDKAVRPCSVMGASKRLAELFSQNIHDFPFYNGRMIVSAVRFGNVLGSNGSVLPRFLEQIEAGGPITVTHRDMERYFMHTSEAAQLVLQAASLAQGGEIFILNMGDPVRIVDMVRRLCALYGLEAGRDIEIVCSGLRPGEKIKEELIIDDAEEQSCYKSIFIIRSKENQFTSLSHEIPRLKGILSRHDDEQAKTWLFEKRLLGGVAVEDCESRRQLDEKVVNY